jgi:PucR C-terminal helix-turn-helix domain/GGDEF-like domain
MFELVGTRGRAMRPAVDDLMVVLAEELLGETPAMAEEVVRTLARDTAYTNIGADELCKSVQHNLEAVLRSLAERGQTDIDPPRETIRRWAERGIALESVLNASRLGFGKLWEQMCLLTLRRYPERLQDLVRDGSRIWELLEAFSRLVASIYQETVVEAVQRDRERRMALVDALFEGRLAVWRRLGGDLRMLGLPDKGVYLAVSAEAPVSGAECLPDVEEYLRRRGVSSVWRLRADEQVGLIALGHLGMKTMVTKMLTSLAKGRVGLCAPFADATETAAALARAALARRCLPLGKAGTATVEDDPLASLVASSPDLSLEVARLWFGKVMDLDPEERHMLLTTLRTWFQTQGRTAEAARLLYCHRNTIRNRLYRLEKLSGRSLKDPRGTAELLIAAETMRLLQPTGEPERVFPHAAG